MGWVQRYLFAQSFQDVLACGMRPHAQCIAQGKPTMMGHLRLDGVIAETEAQARWREAEWEGSEAETASSSGSVTVRGRKCDSVTVRHKDHGKRERSREDRCRKVGIASLMCVWVCEIVPFHLAIRVNELAESVRSVQQRITDVAALWSSLRKGSLFDFFPLLFLLHTQFPSALTASAQIFIFEWETTWGRRRDEKWQVTEKKESRQSRVSECNRDQIRLRGGPNEPANEPVITQESNHTVNILHLYLSSTGQRKLEARPYL